MLLARPLLVGMALTVAMAAPLPARADGPAEVQRRIEAEAGALAVGGRAIDLVLVKDFYRQRGWALAWTGAGEALGEQLLMEVQALALSEGMSADVYAVPATGSDFEHDLLVSDALARFGRDLAAGRVLPSRSYGGMGPETRPAFDPARFLRELAAGRPFAEQAAALSPAYAGYARLKEALARYRQVARAGGWPVIPEGPTLNPGMEDGRVPLLRKRLVATGDLAPEYEKGKKLLDAPIVGALKRFQARHGLDQDGSLGKQTLAALNVPVEERIRQIAMNLERWRWMPRAMAPGHIAVNVPAATLELVEDGQVAMRMRVVVGDTKHPTPNMAATMGSLVLNPPWTVPPSIATREILPKLRRDPNYLAANNLRITAFPEGSPEASGTGMDWSRAGETFPYRLRQQPGPDNALGQLKFNLKDSDDIYLHDTPNRKAFAKSNRALSHGCVRVEKPVDLAERLLGDEWQGRLAGTIAESGTRTLKLERPVQVYLLYWTAWADEDGGVHFRDDLYGHDARLRAALKRARGATSQVAQHQGQGTL